METRPSISVSSWATTRFSTSPTTLARFGAMASISSRKTIAGASRVACSNTSRSRPSDSPTYFCMISGPLTWMNVAWTSVATARAISVLPVPGGPYSSTPRGGSIRIRLKSCGYFIGSSISSRTRLSSRSRPPMSS